MSGLNVPMAKFDMSKSAIAPFRLSLPTGRQPEAEPD